MSIQSSLGRLHISFDFEAGWGVWENGRWRERERSKIYIDLRPTLRKFLKILEDRELSLSWAVVGAMIDDDPMSKLDHLPIVAQRTIYEFYKNANESTTKGIDLFDMVKDCRINQQIGSHTYSHTRFSFPGYSESAKSEDLRLCNDVLASKGVDTPIDMFVFPLNDASDYSALSNNNFRIARTKPKKSANGSRLGKLTNLLAVPPMAVELTNNSRVVEHSGSMFMNWYGKGYRLRRNLVNRQALLGLNQAVQKKTAIHLWLHPFNLVETPNLMVDLTNFLDKAVNLRDKGHISIGSF